MPLFSKFEFYVISSQSISISWHNRQPYFSDFINSNRSLVFRGAFFILHRFLSRFYPNIAGILNSNRSPFDNIASAISVGSGNSNITTYDLRGIKYAGATYKGCGGNQRWALKKGLCYRPPFIFLDCTNDYLKTLACAKGMK